MKKHVEDRSQSRSEVPKWLSPEEMKERLIFGKLIYGPADNVDVGANVVQGVGGMVRWRDLEPGRENLKKASQEARIHTSSMHEQGIGCTTYISPTMWYGDMEHRDKFFAFYDTSWEHYADFFGPKPEEDASTWIQLKRDGSPVLYEYARERGFFWCMNNPHVLQLIKGVIQIVLSNGVDGVFFDGPSMYRWGCYCKYCREKFRAYMMAQFSAEQLGEIFGLASPQEIELPRDATNKPLYVLWNRFKAQTIVDFLRACRDFGRSIYPGFVLTNNYCWWEGSLYWIFEFGAENPELYTQVVDLLFVENLYGGWPHVQDEGRMSNSAGYKYLFGASNGKPVAPNYGGPDQGDEQLRMATSKLAIAEGLANLVQVFPTGKSKMERDAIRIYNEFMKSHPELYVASQPYSTVALLCSLQQSYGGMRSQALGFSRLLQDAGMNHRVITDGGLVTEPAGKYQAIVLPDAPMLSERQLLALEDYMSLNRGFVVYGECGIYDEYCRPRPDGLWSLFGPVIHASEISQVLLAGSRIVYIPRHILEGLPEDGRSPSHYGDMGTLRELFHWVTRGQITINEDLPKRNVEIHFGQILEGEAHRIVGHVVNYNVDSQGHVEEQRNVSAKVLVDRRYTVASVALLSPDFNRKSKNLEWEMIKEGKEQFACFEIPRLFLYAVLKIECIPDQT